MQDWSQSNGQKTSRAKSVSCNETYLLAFCGETVCVLQKLFLYLTNAFTDLYLEHRYIQLHIKLFLFQYDLYIHRTVRSVWAPSQGFHLITHERSREEKLYTPPPYLVAPKGATHPPRDLCGTLMVPCLTPAMPLLQYPKRGTNWMNVVYSFFGHSNAAQLAKLRKTIEWQIRAGAPGKKSSRPMTNVR